MEMKWLKALFAWQIREQRGVFLLWENRVSGARKVTRWTTGGYSPYPSEWLKRGD